MELADAVLEVLAAHVLDVAQELQELGVLTGKIRGDLAEATRNENKRKAASKKKSARRE